MSTLGLFKKGAGGKMYRGIPPWLIAISFFLLAVAALPLALWAQSEQEGIAIYKEAQKLSGKAQSKQDREKALEKYQQALGVFEKNHSDKWTGNALSGIGRIYNRLGRYEDTLKAYDKCLAIRKKLSDVKGEGVILNNIGLVYKNWGQPSKAVEYYEKALEIHNRTDNVREQGVTLSNMAEVYSNERQYTKAVEYYEKSLEIKKKLGDIKGEGVALFRIGNVRRQEGQYPKAIEYYEKSLAIRTKVGDEKGEGVTLNNLGLVYKALRKHDKALGCYEKALAIHNLMADLREQGVTLSNMADLYSNWGKHSKAVETYEKSLAIKTRLGDTKGEMRILGKIASAYDSLGEYEKALESYNKVLAISQKLGDKKSESATLNNVGNIHKSRSRYEKALEYYEKSIAIDRKDGDIRREGATLTNMADVYRSWGQYQKALGNYEKALAIFQKAGDVKKEATILNHIGLVHKSMGQHKKALEYYEKSLAIDRRLGDLSGEGAALANIAEVYRSRGQYSKALEHQEKALAIFQKIGKVNLEAAALNNIGVVYSSWGRYPKALEYHEKSLAIKKRLDDIGGEGASLSNIAAIYMHLGQYKEALEYYKNALVISRKAGLVQDEATVLSMTGHIFAILGEYQNALRDYQAALEIRTRIGVPTDHIKAQIGLLYLDTGQFDKALGLIEKKYKSLLGLLCLLKGDHAGAVRNYQQALALAEKTRSADSLFAACTGLALGYEGLKKYEDAAQQFKRAIDFTEQVRDSLNEVQRANFYDVRIQGLSRIAPYEGLCRVLTQLGRPEESFKIAEATRARLFSELLSRRAQETSLDVPKSILEQDSEITNQLAAAVQELNKAYEKESDKIAIQAFEKQVRDLRAVRETHIGKLRKEYPLFAATKYPQPVALQESAVKKDEWVLEYEVTDYGVVIYLAKGKRMIKALLKPVPSKELDKLVRKVRVPLEIVPGRDSVLEKLKAFDFSAGKRLSDLLLGDILSELPAGAAVIVVPDGSLGVLPFEMLALNTGGQVRTDKKIPYVADAQFFGDRNTVSYCQSITALTLARTFAKHARSGDQMLVVADPVYQMKDPRVQSASPTAIASDKKRFYSDLMVAMEDSSGGSLRFARLPLTGQLAEKLAGAFTGKVTTYTGLAAGKENFLGKIAPDLGRYRSIVFATHGYFGTQIPGIKEPILILSTVPTGTDGFLRMSEVMGCRMSADVVALTACQSGLGKQISGEGTMGMGRAFQYAGAKSVLMSLWSVSEASSVKLVEHFFKHIKDGKSKIDALQLARKAVRQNGFDHPFFWASFILLGEIH